MCNNKEFARNGQKIRNLIKVYFCVVIGGLLSFDVFCNFIIDIVFGFQMGALNVLNRLLHVTLNAGLKNYFATCMIETTFENLNHSLKCYCALFFFVQHRRVLFPKALLLSTF